MATTLFISDLHLDPTRPGITALFLDFLTGDAHEAEALYILGDLFEAWIGDDDPSEHHAEVQDAMARLSASDTATYFMHGNRDFLVGEQFAQRTGFTLLDDPIVIDLYGTPTLLTHGDAMCTDDVDYQELRKQFRDPAWQAQFLTQPLEARQAFANQARARSKAAQAGKTSNIMDVNQGAVAASFIGHDVTRMIHGHTHRPDIHMMLLENRTRQRIVLGDWYEQGSVLRCTEAGMSLMELKTKELGAGS